ncbi:MAG: hypothetical protein WD532_07995 [Acidimicrobiia bacterium]
MEVPRCKGRGWVDGTPIYVSGSSKLAALPVQSSWLHEQIGPGSSPRHSVLQNPS